MSKRTISKPQVIDALNEVFNICEILKASYSSFDSHDRSDADLLDIATKYLKRKIIVREHQHMWDSGPILAFSLEYVDRSEICILGGLNYCHKKLALCKELFHVILSNPDSVSVEFDETIEKCVAGGSLDSIASSEFVAEIAAMEYLFPYTHRIGICKNPFDLDVIAQRYRIPKLIVEQYLTKPRMESLRHCYVESSFAKMILETQ